MQIEISSVIPPIYKKLRKLKNYFEPFQFTINKKFVIEGNEKNIRSFFSFLFPKLFYQKLDIYPWRFENRSEAL
jgi:hypothetical protein